MKYLLYHRRRRRRRRLHWGKFKTSHKCILHSVRWIRKSHMILWYGCALHPFYRRHRRSLHPSCMGCSTHAHTLSPNSRLPSNTAIILWALDDYYYAHCRKYVIRKPKTNIIMDISCYPFVTADLTLTQTHMPNRSVCCAWHTVHAVFGIYSFIAIPCI